MGDWGNAAGGAASGAAAGSAILPGWGTAIGGAIGGLAGYFGGGNDEVQARRDALGKQLTAEAEYLRRIARGQESVSAEQLRQGLQQNIAAQQSMAQGASPQNSAMAQIQASRNAMSLGAGLAGQQALAGIQERQAAQAALMQALLGQRQQEMQATPAPTWLEQWGPAIQGGAQLWGMRGQKPATPASTPTGPNAGNMDNLLGRSTGGPIRY
jgi:cytochrome c556